MHGPLAPLVQTAKTYVRLIAPNSDLDKSVSSYESANSTINEIVRKAVRESDPNPSFVQTRMAIEAMPVALQSEKGAERINNRMIGLTDHTIARAEMMDKYRETRGTVAGFDSWWRGQVSPFAFVVNKMAPDEKLQLTEFLGRTLSGQAEKAQLLRQLQFINQIPGSSQ